MHYDRWRVHGSPGSLESQLATYEKHGLSKTREWRIWKQIRDRCYNSRLPKYKHYGGRGVKVCTRWLNSFRAFYEDMGPRPTLKHSVDRINNDGHYSCGKCNECVANGWLINCRWATQSQQVLNQRRKANSTSGYIGVVRVSDSSYTACIGVGSRINRLPTAEEAAYIRDQAAMQIYGADANLNFEYDIADKLPIALTTIGAQI